MIANAPFTNIACVLPARRANLDAAAWRSTTERLHREEARLLALWGSDDRDRDEGLRVSVALQEPEWISVLELAIDAGTCRYPAIDDLYPAAGRMQRAARDLLGISAEPVPAQAARGWLRHDAWGPADFPLRRDFTTAGPEPAQPYAFVPVTGEGVHEIPVGPVHAGVIEPGHFRFAVVGEKVLRLEERLGYVHKGIEKRFEALPPESARALAARVSGDSAAAFAWAWCMAFEGIQGIAVPLRGLWLRALLLERERIANHLGDLAALGNDCGFAVGFAQFMRVKEDLLRINERLLGARYPLDAIVAGGVAVDLTASGIASLGAEALALEAEIGAMRAIYDGHAGMHDRFAACGHVSPELARTLGLCGLAGRASAQWYDLRCDLPVAPWDTLSPVKMRSTGGDVLARVALRFDELTQSLALCRSILAGLPPGPVRASLPAPLAPGFGIGAVEGWRGPVLVALEMDAAGRIRRCHAHDPSWHNWPVLQHAVIGNIVPDFPLINKSFNLSYSGHDL